MIEEFGTEVAEGGRVRPVAELAGDLEIFGKVLLVIPVDEVSFSADGLAEGVATEFGFGASVVDVAGLEDTMEAVAGVGVVVGECWAGEKASLGIVVD